MTKKHFIALADVLILDLPPILSAICQTDEQAERIECEIRSLLADFCQSQNPAFNRQRWLNYIDGKCYYIDGKCGPNGGRR